MPTRMPREEFWRWARQRQRWIWWLDTSEALLMFATVLWGLQMLFVASLSIREPISQSLLQIWPRVPLPLHGLSLITIGVSHAIAIKRLNRGWRRRMVIAQMCFFMYAEASLLLNHAYGPFVFICLAYVMACIVNYFSLLRPPSTIQEEARRCIPDP